MDINIQIDKQEKENESGILKNAIMFLEKSIIEIMPDNNDSKENLDKIIFPIMHIQIGIELFLKYYVSKIYGFEKILINSQAEKKINNPFDYYDIIRTNKIKTHGFSKLIKLLSDNNDPFSDIITTGNVVFFDLDIGYFEETFEKFHEIRNAAVHSACIVSDKEKKWLKTDFTVFVIFFIYTLLKRINNFEYTLSKDTNIHECTLDETPIEIFKKYLSSEVVSILKNSSQYILEIEEVAMDMGNCYECFECGKTSLVLNIDRYGWSKCFFCGLLYYAGYTFCPLCKTDNSVHFDVDNIKCNSNCMPGYCNCCQERMNVYKCPICGGAYAYDIDLDPDDLFDCCQALFKPIYY